MKIHICGIAGVLGSSLAEYLLENGFSVQGNDQIRLGEAWRLENIRDKFDYQWKSCFDLCQGDLRDVDIVLDCAIGFADRPFGIQSPRSVFLDNLKPAVGVLESLRRIRDPPIAIYGSSFNVFYAEPKTITEDEKYSPSSVYGWSKASAELLYQAYHRAYGIPTVVTRVGSAFGQRGRSDELVHNLIIHALKDEDFYLWSPHAKRLWSYCKDVLTFYGELLEDPEDYVGEILHCAGNKDDKIVDNLELATMVKNITDSSMGIEEGEYELGELVSGTPVTFTVDSSYTRQKLGWRPKYFLEEGLQETVKWFRENLWRYK